MNINDVLPPELLAMIFSKIDDFADKVRLERVCEHWRQTISLDWKITRTCPVPLNNKSLVRVLNRCGEWLEELWLLNVQINEQMVNQMARRMKQLKHLKLSFCRLDGPAVNSIANLFGHQLYSFILDGTNYHPNMRRLIENESSKLEHLNLCLRHDYSAGTLPTKLPNNLKSFSLHTGWNRRFYEDFLAFILDIARECKNLKILHLEIDTLLPNDVILAIGNIKSLVYLNLDGNLDTIQNETKLQNVICRELPNLKAFRFVRYCTEHFLISRDHPNLVHLNVFTRQTFQMPDSLNSLTLQIPCIVNFGQFLPEMLFNQQNKSIQHLDLSSDILPSSSNFIEKLLGQFPHDLKSIHCQMPVSNAYLTSFFSLIEKHLANGRKITIYVHFYNQYNHPAHYKYILPDDFPQFDTDVDWRPKVGKGKCENLVLKKLIKEAIDGGNNPSFLDDWWME